MSEKLKPHLLPCLAIVMLVFAVYGQTLGHDFLSNWDDHIYITRNDAIRGLTFAHLKMAFTSLYLGNYAPVHIISYMFDFSLWGMKPFGFHLANLLLHALNGVLVYRLCFSIIGRRAWAFPAAAVFLIHPVQVESVAWLSQRKNLLAMTFFLLALLCYRTYRQRPPGRFSRPYALAVVFFCLALLSKAVVIILPLVLLLLDRCCESPPRRAGLWLDKLPFFVAAALMGLLTFIVQSPQMGGGRADFYGGSPLSTFFTMLTVLAHYLGILFWPVNLNALYFPPLKQDIDLAVVLALLLAAALTIAGIILLRRNRRLFFGYALFFIGLLPVSQVVPIVTLMNDRYLYFPLLGVAWLTGGVVCRIVDMTSVWQRRLALSVCGVLLALFALVSYQRTAVWKNSVTLWSDAVTKLPDSVEVRAALAEAQLNAGLRSESLRTYEEVFGLQSDLLEPLMERKALNNLAVLYMDNGRFDLAYPLLQQLVSRFPDHALGFINLGYNQLMGHNFPAAEQAYRAAIALEPGNATALMGLGNVSRETGRLDAAREAYRQALASGGNGPELQYNLACLEAKAGESSLALQHLEESLQLGYRNYASLTHNPELVTLRELPAFRQLLQSHFPNMSR